MVVCFGLVVREEVEEEEGELVDAEGREGNSSWFEERESDASMDAIFKALE